MYNVFTWNYINVWKYIMYKLPGRSKFDKWYMYELFSRSGVICWWIMYRLSRWEILGNCW
jgi:hypothetical protein